jgi:SNF2 family DNA or RNA helicase
MPVPQLVVFDESSRCKGATSQRSEAAQRLADMVRDKYGYDGYVIEMSGTPSPKSPLDWWRQCEIAWPGFLKEGSPKALEARLAFLVDHEFDAGIFKKRSGWKDDERKCKHCGNFEGDEHEGHRYEPSVNEVAYLYDRLKGLVIIKHKKDCLDLPDKQYRRVYCKPNASTLRAAEALVSSAPNTITGLTLLRELSDGFQYHDVPDGKTSCPHCCGNGQVDEWFDADGTTYQDASLIDRPLEKHLVDCPRCHGKKEVSKKIRVAKEYPCPKDAKLRELLDECEETGRIVIFAGFTGSVDRVAAICLKEKWDVVRCDGRGWLVTTHEGKTVLDEEALDYWSDLDHPRVAFVSHPETGGMSLTLTESRMAVYWSNSWKPEYRTQSEDRIHRIGMDLNKGCVIVDLLHLPSDERVLDVIRENRRLELLTLGEILGGINWEKQ